MMLNRLLALLAPSPFPKIRALREPPPHPGMPSGVRAAKRRARKRRNQLRHKANLKHR